MSILNVNQIQPVGSGQTVTISATNINTGSATFTGGSVGIGTNNPARLLSVMSASGPILELGTYASGANPSIFLHEGTTGSTINGGGLVYDAVNNLLNIVCGNTIETTRITIKRSDGNVGINTTAISANLEVHTAASKINTQTIKTSAGAGGYAGLAFMAGQISAGREKAALYFQETNNGAHYTGDLVFALNNDSGSAVQVSTSDERLRVTSSGRVGINTTSPGAKLHVYGNSASQVVTLTDGATITPDFSTGNNFTVTLGGNRTLANPTNTTVGQSGVIYIVQDGTGSRTLGVGTHWHFPAGTAPTLTTTGGSVDVFAFSVRSSTSVVANAILDVKVTA